MAEKTLTARQVAERYGVAPSTARAWFLQGIIPRAFLKETELGSFWVVPESALTNFSPPKVGRPGKPKAEKSSRKERPRSAGRSRKGKP